MKRWLSLLLILTLICTSVVGDFSTVFAEETVPQAISESTEPDVPCGLFR